MKVVILGGTGLIGAALSQDLVNDGHEVFVLTRRPAEQPQRPNGPHFVLWDGRSAQGWSHLADNADAIVNLAGENLSAGRWTPERKQRIIDSRVKAGAAVVEAVRLATVKPRMVLQVSGIGAYGMSRTETFDESSPFGKDFLSAVTQVWEASTQSVEAQGVRRAIARTGVVLSTAGGAFPRMVLPFKFFVGGPLGSGKQWLSWIHLDDQIRALRFLIESPQAQGLYNLSATPVTNLEFSKSLGKIMRRPAFFPVPAFAIRLLFGEMGDLVLEGQKAVARRLSDAGFRFHYPDLESALKQLLKQ